MDAKDHVKKIADAREKIVGQMSKVIVGQEQTIRELLIALFSRGHSILIGVPGLAKTLMINTLARIIDLKFKRIQFTPDLMPSDITGTDIIQDDQDTGRRKFVFVRGPVFANILLADEINRTPPKTQAALLQAMQEYNVTASGETYRLEEPFFVLATQNPIEQEGTYPLPEAQLDRFMFSIYMGYPSYDQELDIAKMTTGSADPTIEQVLDGREVLEVQRLVRQVPIADHVARYAVTLATRTRPGQDGTPEFVTRWLSWGAGPRASQYLILGGKARAIMDGRYAVSVEDIRAVAQPVLRHRIVPNFNAEADGVTAKDVVDKLLESMPEKA
ncbi:MAG: MoxR family ATPase [Candidatus Wallbacteria bacterium]|nr:MoxR family ATPase [Candidatus Wallbacteria bacterium]